MDINNAKEIIAILAEGIDPTTGELLDADNVCNKGKVVRAFYTVIKVLDGRGKKVFRKTLESRGQKTKSDA